MVPLIVFGVIFLIVIFYIIGTYNRCVRLRNLVPESWSNVDTELKRRYDLIPNLVETVKGYAAHERTVLESVVRARAAALASTGSPASQARDENALVGTLKSLFAVAEGYPTLKADRHFLHLQKELVETENRIQAARRFYNANVRDLNTLTEMFPSNLIASMAGIQRAEYFETDEVALPQVGF
ncbi:MAG: LemA family protein [Verrucomicrobia bacterium]|nr:LemA family protein [Verrucomicrobiota bacterium]